MRACARALGTTPPRIVPVPRLVARGLLWTVGSLAHLAGRATFLSADKADEYLAPRLDVPGATPWVRDTGWRAEIDPRAGTRPARPLGIGRWDGC